MVWAIRGMTLGRTFIADRDGMEEAVTMLSRLVERAIPGGGFREFADL